MNTHNYEKLTRHVTRIGALTEIGQNKLFGHREVYKEILDEAVHSLEIIRDMMAYESAALNARAWNNKHHGGAPYLATRQLTEGHRDDE